MIITSKDNSKIKHIRKLLDKKNSVKERLFVIEGENLINEAIKNNLLVELYILEGININYDFPYEYVSEDVMKSISNMQSVPRLLGVSKYIDKNSFGKKIILLDDIQDPGNAGTIIRNAVAFDIDTVVFSKNSVSPYNEKVLRSTGGMIYNTNIIIGDLNQIIDNIKSNNIKLYGTSLRSSNSLLNVEKISEFAIIFGNEGNGVHEELLSLCDENIRIDMNNNCESLNVGVSSGIILYHMYKG